MRTPDIAHRRPAGGFCPGFAKSAAAACLAALALVALAGLAACKPTTVTRGTTAEPEPAPEPTVRDHRTGGEEEDAGDDATAEPTEPTDPDDGEAGDEGGEGGGERVPLVPEDHEQYSRVEGTSYDNACDTDADCHTGGCSSEICSAEEGVNSTCIMPAEGWVSSGGSCGCVEGTCSWYTEGGEPADGGGRESAGKTEIDSGRSASSLEGQGEACQDGECPGPLTCLKYYGVAGPQGPQFSSCEIPCPRGESQCPDGQTCVTISDGPGQVCRPAG